MDWQPIHTAPFDGTPVWAWLFDTGIKLMRYSTSEQNAAADGSDKPDDYIGCWVDCCDPTDEWSPKYWLPYDAIKIPQGCVWSGHRWREETQIK